MSGKPENLIDAPAPPTPAAPPRQVAKNKVNVRGFASEEQAALYRGGRAVGARLVPSGYARAHTLLQWLRTALRDPAAAAARLSSMTAARVGETPGTAEARAFLAAALEAYCSREAIERAEEDNVPLAPSRRGVRRFRAFCMGVVDGIEAHRLDSPDFATAFAGEKPEIEDGR